MSERGLRPSQDAEYRVELELLPPYKPLNHVHRSDSPNFGGVFTEKVKPLVLKEQGEIFRVFCGETGKLLLCLHGAKKNPYEDNSFGSVDEVKGCVYGTGYNGMPSFMVKRKSVTLHHRRYITDKRGSTTYFNVSKDSGFVAHNGKVQKGIPQAVLIFPEVLKESRGMAIVNSRNEFMAVVRKMSVNPLITNVSFGGGTELQIDVSPGVDWTAILALLAGFSVLLERERASQSLSDSLEHAWNNFQMGWTVGSVAGAVAGTVGVALCSIM